MTVPHSNVVVTAAFVYLGLFGRSILAIHIGESEDEEVAAMH
jgi:hypothetical protein